MKARLLTKLLNDTKYAVSNHEEYLAIGSPLCHNLINVDKKTFRVKYQLDTFHEGRKSIKSEELEFIWDKLHELISNGQIKEIIDGNDEIENPLPVWTFKDGKLIETYTDKYGWPNTTYDGETMYENTHFKTKKQAIKQAITEYEAGVSLTKDRVKELENDFQKAKDRLSKYESFVEYFKSLK